MINLKNKYCLVTGCNGYIGKAICQKLIKLGAIVIHTDVKKNKIKSKNSFFYKADLTSKKEIDLLVERINKKFKKVDVLVNNAAGNFISPTERLSTKAFDVIVDIVLKGTYNYSLLLGKHWIENKQPGVILNIVTTYAWTGSGFVAPSAAAKGGVLALTRSLAAEWVKYNIRSNAIAPGPFPTKGAWDRLFPKPISKFFNFEKTLPMKRYGNHQELANLAAYMVSDYAGYMNGEVVTLDSGEWIKNAGQFNKLDKIPKKAWGLIERAVRGKKK